MQEQNRQRRSRLKVARNLEPLRSVDVDIIQEEAAVHWSAPIVGSRAFDPGKT